MYFLYKGGYNVLMSILVYYFSGGPHCRGFEPNELLQALAFAEEKRKHPGTDHVCISSQLSESVGKAGVSDPPADYEWSKQGRAGSRTHKDFDGRKD